MLAGKLLASSNPTLKLAFVSSATSGGTSSTQTFSGLYIGSAFTNRRFIVGFTGGAGSNRTVNSATFNGVSMTQLASVSNFGVTAYYEVSYPTGTGPATIVFNLSGSLTNPGFIAYYSYEKSVAATLIDSEGGASSSATKTVTLDTSANGSVLFAANQFNSSTGAPSVSSTSGLDAVDADNSTSTTIRTFSSDLVTPAATGASYSVTFDSAGNSTDKYLGISVV